MKAIGLSSCPNRPSSRRGHLAWLRADAANSLGIARAVADVLARENLLVPGNR